MSNYDHLLSPVVVGKRLFKNRIVMTPTTPKIMQEDENFIAETTMQHYIRRAKNGAAMLTISGLYQFNDTDNPYPPTMWDYYKCKPTEGYNHYLSQMCEAIHGYGAFVTTQLSHECAMDWDISIGNDAFVLNERPTPANHEITVSEIHEMTDRMIKMCTILKQIGFDGISLHMSYQLSLIGRSLSPCTNRRTDQYGGSFENRIRLALETAEGIKKACGDDFLIDAHMTGEERDGKGNLIPGGWSIQDSIRFAEAASGLFDILHLRGWHIDGQHGLWWESQEPPYLYLTEAVMGAKTDTKILCTSGYNDPKMMDEIIRDGKADLIGMARGLVADPDFLEKLYEDRPEDIVPCIRCNKCFTTGPLGKTPRTCRCSVNPGWGMESRERIMFTAPHDKKKVAVVGAGPAGMYAATIAKKRGHEVEIFEKADKVGGQLNVADYSPRKITLKKYRDYLAGQINKLNIPLHLNTEVTGEELAKQGYDIIVAALGSTPKKLTVPGADKAKVKDIFDAYGKEETLGENVTIIGSGMTALETGLHLAEDHGKKVTVLARGTEIGKDMPPIHYRVPFLTWVENTKNLEVITEASLKEITDEGVVYVKDGQEVALGADSVIGCVGMEPNFDGVMALAGKGPRIITIGDNRASGSIMDLTRDAYFAMRQF